VSVSTQSAPGGIRTPNLLIRIRCVSTFFIPCCLSTESGTVVVARYRTMLGIREQSAPTDAPTPSGLIARRWNEEVREGEDLRGLSHGHGQRERLVPERSTHGKETYRRWPSIRHSRPQGPAGPVRAARYPRVRRKSRRLARPGRSPRTRRPCQLSGEP